MSPDVVALRGRWLLAAAIWLLLPWLILLYVVHPWNGGSALPIRRNVDTPAPRNSTGPWGEIEYTRIMIAPPDEFLREMLPVTRKETAWYFTGMTLEAFGAFVEGLDISEERKAWMTGALRAQPLIGGYRMLPDAPFVRALSPTVRARLYGLLGESELNPAQERAYRFCGDPDEWFADARLPADVVDLMRTLVYENGRVRFFGDADLVLPLLENPQDRLELVKTLARESTLLMRLRIDADTDIDRLADYWGKGGRNKDVRPLLESLSRLPGEQHIDVVHLLPPFARRRLYTYPHAIADEKARMRDCHWTALNFFNEIADERLTDPAFQLERLTNDYYPIEGDPEFGDLVFFTTGSNQLFHTAVHIADDVVFTKNGAMISRPWMLVRLDDMKHYYPKRDPVEVTYFRRKGD